MTGYSGRVNYGRQQITFRVVYVARKTLEIAVHPDANVLVKAPLGTTSDAIKKLVIKRARWIRKQLDYFHQFEPRTPSHLYVGGATHFFLGRQYRLKVRKSRENNVKLKGQFFCITIADPSDTKKIKDLLKVWYHEHAHTIFVRRLELWHKAARSLKIPLPKIRVRRMLRRWGSCSKSGDILLNTELVKAPLYCIDYVIMHELCHLKIHAHNSEYYRLLSKYMPDWEQRKKRLEMATI